METAELRTLPKISLHDHLDGGVRPDTLAALAAARGISYRPESLRAKRAGSLGRYLQSFEATTLVLQDHDALRRVASEAIEDLAAQGVAHAELRFAPALHTRDGLDVRGAIEAVVEGMSGGTISSTLIVCLLRGDTRNPEVIAAADRAGAPGGFDIAGDESRWPLSMHMRELRRCVELGYPLTVHAGESGGLRDIKAALDAGARRIGHGVALANEILHGEGRVLERVVAEGVCLEMCVSSNLDTGVVYAAGRHPIEILRRAGVQVTVNTDNRTVSQTTMCEELQLVAEAHGWGRDDVVEIQLNAVRHAFVEEDVRARLGSAVRGWALG